MSISTVDSQTPHVLVLSSPADVNSGGQVVITPENLASGGAGGGDVWLPIVFTTGNMVITPATVSVPAPVTGTVIGLAVVATGQPNGTITFTPAIGGAPVTNGDVSLLATDAAGVVKHSTASGANAVTAFSSAVLITTTTANSAVPSFRVTLLVGFRPA